MKMKLIIIIYFLPLIIHAQDEFGYKLYVDSLRGFSLQIPKQQSVKGDPFNYRYKVLEGNSTIFYFHVETKTKFIDEFLRFTIGEKNIDPADSLLSVAKARTYNFQELHRTGFSSYFRTDSLYEWSTDDEIRIIEFNRTMTVIQDGGNAYKKVGPVYYLYLTTSKGEFVLIFNFTLCTRKKDLEISRKIVSSIKVLE